jgi:hypothetical protein
MIAVDKEIPPSVVMHRRGPDSRLGVRHEASRVTRTDWAIH